MLKVCYHYGMFNNFRDYEKFNSFITIQQDTKFMKKMYKILMSLVVTLYTTIHEQLELQLEL